MVALLPQAAMERGNEKEKLKVGRRFNKFIYYLQSLIFFFYLSIFHPPSAISNSQFSITNYQLIITN